MSYHVSRNRLHHQSSDGAISGEHLENERPQLYILFLLRENTKLMHKAIFVNKALDYINVYVLGYIRSCIHSIMITRSIFHTVMNIFENSVWWHSNIREYMNK